MQRTNRPSYVIGIDPAFREYGNAVAIIDNANRTITCQKFRYPEQLFDWLSTMPYPKEEVLWMVENSAINDTSFTYATAGKKPREALSMARNLGKNQAISIMVVRILKNHYDGWVSGISPEQKGKKRSLSQINALLKQDRLELLKSELSQDEIDAVQLALIGYNQPALYINQI